MAQNAIRPHLETIVLTYLNTVKKADKALLKKPFTIENDVEFIHDVEQLIASSYMLGIFHADEETGKSVNAADTDIPPIPFTEAVNFLKEKVPMTKKEWSALEPKLRFRAFTVAKLGSAKTIDVVRQQLIGAIEDGSGYAETWRRIKDTLQNSAQSLTPGYWENVFRTNTQSAYIAGKLEQYEKNGVAAYQLMVIEDSRTSHICRNLLNKSTGYCLTLPVNHIFWKTYGFPPYHYQCRTSISGISKNQIEKNGSNVDNVSINQLRDFKPLKDFGGNPLDKGSWWDMTSSMKKQAKKLGVNDMIQHERAKFYGGSSGGILDKNPEEQEAYAKRAYEEIRKKDAKSDIEKVAKSSGLSKKDIEKIRNHIFFDKHELEKGFERFDESPIIANSWEALENGRANELNILLLKHELEELTLMKKYGYDYSIAHLIANQKYPWEYKIKGGFTDDSIQTDIEKRLKELL